MDIVVSILGDLRDHTRHLVDAILDSELNYHFTNDLNFKDHRGANQEQQQQQQQPQFDSQGRPIQPPPQQPVPQPPKTGNQFVKDLRQRIDNYFALVLRNMRDTIPKQIGFFLVKKSQEALQQDLYMRINANASIADALGEPKHITDRRHTLNTLIKTLNDSVKLLTRDPELTAAHMDDSALSEDIRQEAMRKKQQPPPQQQRPPSQ